MTKIDFINLAALLVIVGLYCLLKFFGFKSYSRKIVKKKYDEFTISSNGEIYLSFLEKKFFFFKKMNTYRLKYVKAKGTYEEIKEYLDIVLSKPFLIYKFSTNIFGIKKKDIEIFVRSQNQIPPMDRMPIYLLPKVELNNILKEGIEIGIFEVNDNQFTTLIEKKFVKKNFENLEKKQKNN